MNDERASVGRDEHEELVKKIEDDIISGGLLPGERLIEDNLMENYRASRHFVRQALMHLERVGMIERKRNIGATVCSYSSHEIEQMCEVREILLRHAALMIRLPASISLIEKLAKIQSKYVEHIELRDLRNIHDTNDAFHAALFEACENQYLVRSIQNYMALTFRTRAKNIANTENLSLSIKQHDLMICLLQSNDNWALSQLYVEHIDFSEPQYSKQKSSLASLCRAQSLRSVPRE